MCGEEADSGRGEGFVGLPLHLMMYGHNIHLVKCSRAGGTFAHAVADAVVDTLVAEEVATRLEGRVLEVVATNGAQGECLFLG